MKKKTKKPSDEFPELKKNFPNVLRALDACSRQRKKSMYTTMHEVSDAFVKLVTRLEKKLGKQINYNFEIRK